MGLDKFLNNMKTLAVVCNQWGDTGKGKFVDYFAEWADIIARGTGGANAGHTIIINDKKYVFHLVPSGIIHDDAGKINIIGNGVAFDPRATLEELSVLEKEKKSFSNLKIAYNAKLILPQHLVMDRITDSKESSEESKVKIGTTGRGIGPLYTDHYARTGLIVNDMLNKDIFARKLKENLTDKVRILKQRMEEGLDPEKLKEVMNHKHLENGRFYDSEKIFNLNAIVETYSNYGNVFRGMIEDTDEFMHSVAGRKKVLLEGAQGLLLSVDYGSYPYVTSSDCSVRGLAKGVGLSEKDIDLTLGIAKAFYMTRVGEGPFPTELGREKSAEFCSSCTKADEDSKFPDAKINDSNEFMQGIAIRRTGQEYGATTGRPRRTGWLDLPLLRYARKINGPNIILSKVDVLSDCDEIKICNSYVYEGPDYNTGSMVLSRGNVIDNAFPISEVLKHCRPEGLGHNGYKIFPGWKSDISNIKQYNELPSKFKDIVEFIEEQANVNVKVISVGPEREQTILK